MRVAYGSQLSTNSDFIETALLHLTWQVIALRSYNVLKLNNDFTCYHNVRRIAYSSQLCTVLFLTSMHKDSVKYA